MNSSKASARSSAGVCTPESRTFAVFAAVASPPFDEVIVFILCIWTIDAVIEFINRKLFLSMMTFVTTDLKAPDPYRPVR